MSLPIINHDDYVAKINDDNKFPIKKFGELARYLLSEGVTKKFIQPEFCSVETLSKAEYVAQDNIATTIVKSPLLKFRFLKTSKLAFVIIVMTPKNDKATPIN